MRRNLVSASLTTGHHREAFQVARAEADIWDKRIRDTADAFLPSTPVLSCNMADCACVNRPHFAGSCTSAAAFALTQSLRVPSFAVHVVNIPSTEMNITSKAAVALR